MSLPFSLYGPLGGDGSPATVQGTVAAFGDAPTALIASDPAFGVIGSVVNLDGRGSTDPNQKLLSYTWSFQSVPIGSKVELEGFKTLDTETDPSAPVVGSPSVVSFSPDIVGEYLVGLVVSNGIQDSVMVTQVISIRAIMVPHGRGLVPDGKFIWSYIRDVWTQVDSKEWFETLWSALIQIVGADMLSLYQVDYNKSIRDIQDQMQRRWLSYEPKLLLDRDDVSFFLDYQQAGTNASTQNSWLRLASTVLAGSSFAVPYNNGVNDLSTVAAGRVVVLGGRALKLTRQHKDTQFGSSYILATSDVSDIPTGMTSLNWRAPHTLISKNNSFEELGIAAGDLLMLELTIVGTQLAVDVPAQVVGVIGDRLAFVLTDQPVTSGVIATIPNSTYLDISEAFGINTVSQNGDQTLSFSGLANTLLTDMKGGLFKSTYFNTELTPDSVIVSNGLNFSIRPKHIIRNRFVPVDASLVSIPLLQEYIKQPELTTKDDGSLAIVRGEKEFLVSSPQWLSENVDFIIGDEIAADEKITFKTGSSIIEADTADFIDRNMLAGDTFTIVTPTSLAGDYPIKSVLAANKLQLSKPVPSYVLGPYVTARVQLKRRRVGNFVRFVPGRFSAASPAPARLWAEVSFFDNNQTIEDNFGILVGLKKEDIDNITTNVSYRQAVTGLMYALTRGSAVSKIELGVKILLGLPFSEHRGIIRSIEDNYRLAGDGTSILGRLLVEDIDESDVALGTMRVYTYPIDDANPDFSGIETNPTTNLPYVVGDVVEKLVSLSNGVEVTDYQNDPLVGGSVQQYLQQFHSFKVKINSNIFTSDEFVLVSEFLKKITPSYVAYVLPVVKAVFDAPTAIVDSVTKKLSYLAQDNASFGLPFAIALDQRTKEGVRTSRLGAGFSSRKRYGTDLIVAAQGFSAASAAGGFLNPKAGESFNAPLCRAEDRLIIFDGPNRDSYQISSLVDGSLSTYTTGDLRNLLYLWHCDEASGNLIDATGRLPLTASGSPGAVTGLLNGGRSVSSGNAFLFTLVDTTLLDAVLLAAAWTVKFAFWIDPTVGSTFPTPGNGNGTVLSFGAVRMLIGFASNGTLRYYATANAGTSVGNWTNLSKGVWHRMAVRSTPVSPTKANIDFFIDGVYIGSANNVLIPTGLTGSPSVTIGGEGVAFDCFKGQLDEIEMWTYPQTDEEIRMGGKQLAPDVARNFAIMRRATGPIRSGSTCTVTSGNAQVILGAGLRTDGVQPGDWLIFGAGSGASLYHRYQVISVDSNSGVYDRVTITPTPSFTATPAYRVVRRTLIDSDEMFLFSSGGGTAFTGVGANWWFLRGMAEAGDELQVVSATLLRFTVIDPINMVVNGSIPAGFYQLKLIKKARPNTAIGFNHISRNDPDDTVQITSAYTGAANASCTAASPTVNITAPGPFELGARPGDLLVLVGGTNGGVDRGYGPGVYPIKILAAGQAILSVSLTATETLQWKVMRNR